MAFVDEVTLHLKAGDGGNGVVAWLHEKGKEFMGPAGGDGGKGGDVYFKAVRDMGRLATYRYGNLFSAERGGHGEGKSRHGKDGSDIELEVPIGSVIRNERTGRTYELLNDGERVCALRGGRGGFGNEHFKSSRNIRPRESTPGKSGEETGFHVELRLFADAGLIGLPNAGKSSLLNALTRAHAKVGAYAFTTLEPHLGVMVADSFNNKVRSVVREGLAQSANGRTSREIRQQADIRASRGQAGRASFILADIPGLIEGASEGKGLGIKFLKHITRTKLLLHCLSLENEDLSAAYEVVRKELAAFSPALAKKPELVVLTKTDIVEATQVKKALAAMKKRNPRVFAVSVTGDKRLQEFREELLLFLNIRQF